MKNVIDKNIFFLRLQKYNNFFRVNATKTAKNPHPIVTYGLLHRRLKRRLGPNTNLNLNFNKEHNHVDSNKTDR